MGHWATIAQQQCNIESAAANKIERKRRKNPLKNESKQKTSFRDWRGRNAQTTHNQKWFQLWLDLHFAFAAAAGSPELGWAICAVHRLAANEQEIENAYKLDCSQCSVNGWVAMALMMEIMMMIAVLFAVHVIYLFAVKTHCHQSKRVVNHSIKQSSPTNSMKWNQNRC